MSDNHFYFWGVFRKNTTRLISIVLSLLIIIAAVESVPVGKDGKVEAAADHYIAVTVTKLYDYAYEVLDYVNEERRKAGLNELDMDQELLDAAMQRAAESAVIGAAYYANVSEEQAHTRPDGTDCFTVTSKSYGENIAYGQSTPFKVMYYNDKNIDPNNSEDMNHKSWMRSVGHRNNIMQGEKRGSTPYLIQ